jgi:HAD superfamily hydrolase (TIGR01509 family)
LQPAAPPQAAVFDVDGLLLDTEGLWTRAQRELFAMRGREFTLEHKRAFVGVSGPVAEARLEELLDVPGEGPALLAELNGLVMREAESGAEPMPGARELVAALDGDGKPLALVSNSPREWVDAVLAPSGLAPRFGVILTPDEGLAHKPEPALYLEACRELGVEPAVSVGLEDTAIGIAAAKAAGLVAIGVPSVPGVELDGADLVAPSLADSAVWRALGLGSR